MPDLIYRGFDIRQQGGKWAVYNKGVAITPWMTKEQCYEWIDLEKKRQSEANKKNGSTSG